MKRFLVGLFVFGLAAVFAVPAQASALSLLSFNGQPDLLEDEDFESFVDADGSGTINAGDFVVGMYYIQTIDGNAVGTGEDTFTGLLMSKINSVVRDPLTGGTFSDTWFLDFVAVDAADFLALTTVHGFSSLERNNVDSAVVVYENSEGVVDPGAGADANAALATAKNGPVLFEFGFDGNTQSTAIITADANGMPLVDDEILLADVNALTFFGGLNETFNSTDIEFLPLDVLGLGTEHQLQFTGGGDSSNPGHFQLATDLNIHVNPVPEPGSLALLATFAVGLMGAGYRHRRAAKKNPA